MVCIINPITNRAVRTDTKLGKKLVKLADDIEDEIKAEKKIKAAAKRALKQKEFKNVKQASSQRPRSSSDSELDKNDPDYGIKKAFKKLDRQKATTKKATTKTAPAPTPMGAAGGDNNKYKNLDVLDDDELGFALMHYYRKNYKGDNPWTSFLAKPRSSLMYTIKKNDIKLSVKKPLDAQPKGDELNPDEIKRLKFKKEMMELYKKK